MKQKLISVALAVAMAMPGLLWAQSQTRQVASARPQAAAPPAAVQSDNSSQTQSARPQPRARRRSYERETHTRRHSGISKEEKVFLVAVAGSSMGIGAIAGGGTGLAIGAIVGGWGAYAAHKMWHWIR